MEKDGATLIGESLKEQKVDYMFGVVGIPIIEVGYGAQLAGINYIGMRNEQAASYAASIMGYLTKRPSACLVVPGPGLIHALSGMANAYVNCWPLLVIAGSYDQDQVCMGGFQEWPQMESVQSCTKFSARIETLESIPFLIEKAVRCSIYGRPGPTYIEIPGNLVTEVINIDNIKFTPCCPDPPIILPDPNVMLCAVSYIKEAKKPLVIIGKGAAYSQAENQLRKLLVTFSLPFLPTPMGKGVVPDDHPLCVAAARSKVLKEADVILLVGARLNWILHFGRPPRFDPGVKFIQVDISPEEMSNGVVMLCGDAKAVTDQLVDSLHQNFYPGLDIKGSWWTSIKKKMDTNVTLNETLAADESVPMSYYCAYKQITDYIPRNAIIVNEGANTMDIGRTVLKSYYPRHRLDAGTFGTMGVGCGFAIAAALYNETIPLSLSVNKKSPVFCIQGDSAFGFSGMEVETACRYQLPIVFIIMNNSGIYRGLDQNSWENIINGGDLPHNIPPTTLIQSAKYNKIAECFGANGYNVTTPQQLSTVMRSVMSNKIKLPVVINVAINSTSARRKQEFPWLTKSKL